MTFAVILAWTGVLLSLGLGLGVMVKTPRTFAPRAFAFGMGLFALREMCIGLTGLADTPLEAMRWQRLGWDVTLLLPGSWLLFSLAFARSNFQTLWNQWKWPVLATQLVSLGCVIAFHRLFFGQAMSVPGTPVFGFALSWSGYAGGVFGLLMALVVLVRLETTFRAATGVQRWHLKFMVLGVGTMFVSYVYTMSQILLYSAVFPFQSVLDSWAVVIACPLMMVSLARDRLLRTQITLSQKALRNSLTLFLGGIYLLAVGGLAKVVSYWGGNKFLPLGTFLVFGAFVGLAIILLSEEWRQKTKSFVSRHVYRTRYDYRYVWMEFTKRTASVDSIQALCATMTRLVAETFGVPAVSLWLGQDDGAEGVVLGGSTVFPTLLEPPTAWAVQDIEALMSYMRGQHRVVDCNTPPDSRGRALLQRHGEGVDGAYIRYCVPLRVGEEFLGIITLHDRLLSDAFTLEDEHVLKVIADQAAASLLNLRLTQQLLRAKQLEAFQTLSAFFVHDLKNLAARLSVTLKSFPMHYENPAFREDLLRVIAGSVEKINSICGRLSLMTENLELHCEYTDLNALVRATLAELETTVAVVPIVDLQPLPPLAIDTEQIQKVVMNLVLNANEAIDADGTIRVHTEARDDWVILTVQDNGCGMTKEFIEHSLFQPFQTTKCQGLGIGLFQCKSIIEAHRGRIDVVSEEGEGSTFCVSFRIVSCPVNDVVEGNDEAESACYR